MSLRRRIVSVLLCLSLSGGALAAQEAAQLPAPLDAEVATAPVVIDGAELFRLRGVTGYPAARRAQEITARIERLAADASVAPESLAAVQSPNGIEIRSGSGLILTVTAPDAEFEGLSQDLFARILLQRIQEAMRSYREVRTRESLMRGLLRALAALAVFAVAVLGRALALPPGHGGNRAPLPRARAFGGHRLVRVRPRRSSVELPAPGAAWTSRPGEPGARLPAPRLRAESVSVDARRRRAARGLGRRPRAGDRARNRRVHSESALPRRPLHLHPLGPQSHPPLLRWRGEP